MWRVINRRLEILSKYYIKIYAKTFKTLTKCMISLLKIISFISFCFWPCWVFTAARVFFSCSAWTSHCGGFSVAEAGLWGTEASVTAAQGPSRCGSRARAQAQ